jgi:Ran GTPase-activating protein 1
MVPFLSQNIYYQVFKLNNNGLGIAGGKVISGAIRECARKAEAAGLAKSNLRVVVCGRNRLENGSAPNWAEAFSAHKGLKEIRMPQNGIRMEGISALAKGLSACTELESLDFQDNTATRTGTRAIVAELPKWKNLKKLNLSDCLISNAGGIALATSLASGSNKELQELKLQYGEFDKRTVELLTEAISQHLTKLEVLELNGNRFEAEDECVEKLKEALALHGHEEALDERESMSGNVDSWS